MRKNDSPSDDATREIERLKAMFVSDKPSDVMLTVNNFEQAHTAKMLDTYNPFIKMTEDALDIITHTIDYINYIPKDDWKGHRNIQYLSLPEVAKALLSGFQLLIRGDIQSTFRSMRGVYEYLMALVFVSCHKDDDEAVWNPFSGHRQKSGTTAYHPTSFVKDNLKLDFGPLYSIWSLSACGNRIQTLKDAIQMKKDEEDGAPRLIGVKFEWNEKNVQAGMNCIYFLSWMSFRLIDKWFLEAVDLEVIGKDACELIDRFRSAMKCFGLVLKHSPNMFSGVPDTVDSLLDIVTVAEQGGDWKARARHLTEQRNSGSG